MSVESMQTLLDEFRAAFNRNDAKQVASLYVDDVRLLVPGQDIVQGKAGAESVIANFFEMGVRGVDFEALTRQQENNLGIEVGRYTLRTAPDGDVVDQGKYVSIRREQPDGRWLIELDIFNSSEAQTAPPHQ